jgi:hypothetical protein
VWDERLGTGNREYGAGGKVAGCKVQVAGLCGMRGWELGTESMELGKGCRLQGTGYKVVWERGWELGKGRRGERSKRRQRDGESEGEQGVWSREYSDINISNKRILTST